MSAPICARSGHHEISVQHITRDTEPLLHVRAFAFARKASLQTADQRERGRHHTKADGHREQHLDD